MDRVTAIGVLYSDHPDEPQLVAEYIREAEHQDGSKYWKQFKRRNDLRLDFKLYKEAK